ncbi:MAG TPA: hypothetical protein VGQ03_06785 [Nitrososphaera sp.]|jgi:ABC-type dipeptide/oligopeptide/nickel transport system permease component|nr:hypothetical protein [Nitrososphaera sp.]
MQGFVAFIMRRSITGIITLGVVVAIIIVVLNVGMCSQLDAIIAQIKQQIEDEIIAKHLTFATPEEMQAYINMRLQQELTQRGLDVCV